MKKEGKEGKNIYNTNKYFLRRIIKRFIAKDACS